MTVIGHVVEWYRDHVLLSCLLTAMVFDVAMGLLVAKNGLDVNSAASFRGMSKKVAVLMIIGLAWIMEGALMELFKTSTSPFPFAGGIAAFYIAWELISITENAATLGLPIPENWVKALSKLRTMGGGEATVIAPKNAVADVEDERLSATKN
jgi:toxin secretion/phage lysis holin